ncbi:MAG: haloacid dehalogenase [Anaerolineae bacterium]
MTFASGLDDVFERIRAHWTHKSEVRDLSLGRSRAMIRFCANSIRATHRREFELAGELLAEAKAAAATMSQDARDYADIYYAGYTQDALKELAEAAIVLAMVTDSPLPDPETLDIPYAAYLNGLGEAMGEARRYALDSVRRGELDAAERMLSIMDDAYSLLVTMDFPDTMTGGLRRTTDMVRGVTEKTRGDLTTSAQQEKLQHALEAFEARLMRPPSDS